MNTYVFLFLVFPTFRHNYDILKWQSRRAQTTEQELKTTRRFHKDCTCQNPERLWLVRFLYVASSRTVVFAKLAGEICWFIHQKKEWPSQRKVHPTRQNSIGGFWYNLDEWHAKNPLKKVYSKRDQSNWELLQGSFTDPNRFFAIFEMKLTNQGPVF